MQALAQMELTVLEGIQSLLGSPLMDALMQFFSLLGNKGAIWIAVGLVLLCRQNHRRQGAAVLAALVLCLLIGNLGLKPLVGRLRPFQVNPSIALIIPPPGEFSFPSGHTMSSFAAAGVLRMFYKRMGTAALLLAALIGFSRMYLFVHFLTDVLVGMLLGLLTAWITVTIGRRKRFLPQ